MVAAEFPQARLIARPDNLGFAGGNNLALRELGFCNPGEAGPRSSAQPPDLVLLLNPDAEPLGGDAHRWPDGALSRGAPPRGRGRRAAAVPGRPLPARRVCLPRPHAAVVRPVPPAAGPPARLTAQRPLSPLAVRCGPALPDRLRARRGADGAPGGDPGRRAAGRGLLHVRRRGRLVLAHADARAGPSIASPRPGSFTTAAPAPGSFAASPSSTSGAAGASSTGGSTARPGTPSRQRIVRLGMRAEARRAAKARQRGEIDPAEERERRATANAVAGLFSRQETS